LTLQHHPGAVRQCPPGADAAFRAKQTPGSDARIIHFSFKNQGVEIILQHWLGEFAAPHKKDLHFLESALK